MAYITVFKRNELKYLLTEEQCRRVMAAIAPYMEADAYGRTTIRNVYYDTDTYRLIRHSIEKPAFKEKLRLRSYAEVTEDGTVFAEIKRKYHGTVYKRRLPLTEREATAWLSGERPPGLHGQIASEIDYFISYYETLAPRVFLSYEREAYFEREGTMRVTFDRTVLARCEALSLREGIFGTPLLPEGTVLMELKCAGGMPLFMAKLLSREEIRKTSFSKYGTAYTTLIFSHSEVPSYAGSVSRHL